MNANARVRSGSWQQRYSSLPLGVLAPRSWLVLPLLLTALALTPALLAAVVVASDNGTARAAVFVAIALIVAGIVVGLHRPSVLVTYLHMIGALIMGCALIWVVARAVFAPKGAHAVGYEGQSLVGGLAEGIACRREMN
jgi:sugar phosphate permease